MNHDLYEQATYPLGKYPADQPWPANARAVQAVPGPELLRRLTAGARERALDVLAAAMVRADALELADALGGVPLQRAKAEAAEPEAAVTAARKALAKEEHSIAGRLASYFTRKASGTVGPGEGEPGRDTERVRELKAAVAAAEQEAAPFASRIRYHESQIAALRAVPAPDPAALEGLGLGRHVECPPKREGGHRDSH